MPRGDGTGPMKMGSETVRGAGFCGGRGVAGFASSAPGLGLGRGHGRGRRNIFYATGLTGRQRAVISDSATTASDAVTPSKQQEVDALKQQATALAEMLDGIRQRINKIES
jgi:hypothetical protein